MTTYPKPSLPKKIGKYEVVRLIGRGTTSMVYLARDPLTDRKVAIKQAVPEILKDPDRGRLYTRLFLNEASLVGKLSHPYIVQIYSAMISDPVYYIVMEYVQGGTLEEYCAPWKLPSVDNVVEIISKCAHALNFACRSGIIHRDIKPANILVPSMSLESVDVKISDFGAALVDTPDRTQVSGIGSPAYMSPQQVMELPLNHQTDIYSLGIVMYQILTGQLPFQGNTNYNIVYQIINNEPPSPSSIRGDIPKILDRIVAKAICKETLGRYATWDEFIQDLDQCSQQPFRNVSQDNFSDNRKIETLAQLSFFSEFTESDLFELLAFMQWSSAEPGQTILHDGETNGFFCVLAEGVARISKNGLALCRLKAGECFGELSAINKHYLNCNVDVFALTDVRIVMIRNEALRHVSDACRARLHQAFLENLTRRLSGAYAKLAAF